MSFICAILSIDAALINLEPRSLIGLVLRVLCCHFHGFPRFVFGKLVLSQPALDVFSLPSHHHCVFVYIYFINCWTPFAVASTRLLFVWIEIYWHCHSLMRNYLKVLEEFFWKSLTSYLFCTLYFLQGAYLFSFSDILWSGKERTLMSFVPEFFMMSGWCQIVWEQMVIHCKSVQNVSLVTWFCIF